MFLSSYLLGIRSRTVNSTRSVLLLTLGILFTAPVSWAAAPSTDLVKNEAFVAMCSAFADLKAGHFAYTQEELAHRVLASKKEAELKTGRKFYFANPVEAPQECCLALPRRFTVQGNACTARPFL